MREPRSGPTVGQIVLGRRLQHLRETAGLTLSQAAAALDVNAATVRRMEKAEVGFKLLYVRTLLQTYGVGADESHAFIELAKDANQPGWWHQYRDVLPEWFSLYVSLEGAATVIRAYEPHHVPGLLQTEDYARAVLRLGFAHVPDELERHVALRLERQSLLTRPNAPHVWVVMDETALRRPAGTADVMRSQVDRLIEATRIPNVTLQVMPFAAGLHSAAFGPFHLFRFQEPELPDIVYGENLTGAVYLDDPVDVAAHREALDRLGAQAVPADATAAFLGGIRKEI